MAGLVCASSLQAAGSRVTVFDKGRGPAGRMSTRRGAVPFDHGAQYFTARDPAFQADVDRWIAAGLVSPWPARVVRIESPGTPARDSTPQVRYVCVPGMNAVARALASGLDLRTRLTISSATQVAATWRLGTLDGVLAEPFDALVLTAPPSQTAAVLGAHPLADMARRATMAPCWAVMAVWPDALPLPYDAAFVHGSPLSWLARDGSKPGRPYPHAWVLHGSPTWSEAHLESTADDVTRALLAALAALAPQPLPVPSDVTAHRWRYARPVAALVDRCVWDAEDRVGLAGDWCGGPRVEGAWTSGRALAQQMLNLTDADQHA
ncbi:MAG: FAD-dependent oxidoreductase [Acidobacteria bacterium]|nr:FAD-dependent oxidoreductase [Acidobacteriota bacterium]